MFALAGVFAVIVGVSFRLVVGWGEGIGSDYASTHHRGGSGDARCCWFLLLLLLLRVSGVRSDARFDEK